jgi:hypothetical protein
VSRHKIIIKSAKKVLAPSRRFLLKIAPVKTPASFIGLAFFASVIVCSISTLSPQTDSLVPSAPVSPPPAPSAVVTFASGQAIRSHSAGGRFAPVPLNPLDTTAITLQFPTTLAGTPVTVQPLDGGGMGLTNQSAAIASDGTISFQFQAGTPPGLYRVLVIAGATASMVQFSVPPPTSGQ